MENFHDSVVSEASFRMSMSVLVNIVENCDYKNRKSFRSILAAFIKFVRSLSFINFKQLLNLIENVSQLGIPFKKAAYHL